MPKTLPKVNVVCPHCGFFQPEPARVMSTYCRDCGLYYEVGPPPKPGLGERLETRWREFRESVRPKAPERRWVTCFECGYHQRVAAQSWSTICPCCGSYMALRDIEISTVFSRAIKTRGKISVHADGQLKCSKVEAHEITVDGVAFADFDCTGTVRVNSGGVMGGLLRCAHLIVERGGNIDRVRMVEAREITIDAKAMAKDLRALKVNIGPHGYIEGNMVVEAFNVEEGGHFSGNLRIAQKADREKLARSDWRAGLPPIMKAPNVDAEPVVEEILASRGLTRV